MAASENDLAALIWLGHEREAVDLLHHALGVYERALGPESLEVGSTLALLATVHRSTGEYPLAGAEFERAEAIEEHLGAPAETQLAETLNSYGLMLLSENEAARAFPRFDRALEIRRRVLGPGSPTTLATLLNRAASERELGHTQAAVQDDERVVAGTAALFGTDHSLYAYAIGEMATARGANGDLAGARALYPQAIAILEKTLGRNSRSTAIYHREFALLLERSGDERAALAEFESALAVFEASLDHDHPRIATVLLDVARTRLALGETQGVEAALRRACDIERKREGRQRGPGPLSPCSPRSSVGTAMAAGCATLGEAGSILGATASAGDALAAATRACRAVVATAAQRRQPSNSTRGVVVRRMSDVVAAKLMP